ncbi:MAG: hypothetical protein DRQ40_02655 [Gammaproteobacteria bacterium]|nr:MAG: hypothetical protein DRQ40_02655 [Gammaproteobacteria bacterium]
MNKIEGVKSVDFKITAFGHGVVNWNGPTALKSEKGADVNNHSLPKLRGYNNLNGVVTEKGFKFKKEATDINLEETPLYISQNCVRHHIFRDHAFDLHFAKEKSLEPVLASITGLVRGYVVASSQSKRTSCLLIEDFVDSLHNGNFEQMGKCGTKDGGVNDKGEEIKSNSFFSKTTFGDTQYTSYGSISIEQLQFISLDQKFDRCAMKITDHDGELIEGSGESIAKSIQEYIQTLNSNLNPEVVYHKNYVRNGTIYHQGEHGIMLNNDAIQAVIEHTLEMIRSLTIRQSKSYMAVDSIEIDYNDSNSMMRIKRAPATINSNPNHNYATYFATEEA